MFRFPACCISVQKILEIFILVLEPSQTRASHIRAKYKWQSLSECRGLRATIFVVVF